MEVAQQTTTKYPSYKSSGVEWLGEIPEHWDLTRLGTRFEERRTKVSDKDFPPLSVTKNGTVPQLANAAKSNDGDNRKLVMTGDFVINSRSDRKGSSGIAYQDGSVSLIYIVLEPLNINPTYCNYLLKSYNFIEEFYRMGHGIVADLWTTRYDEMRAIMVGIPPLQEQTDIAQFLDDKTQKIDQAIAIKEEKITLLKERKQILIHKAVTRGLNQNAKLKDSGVEWIGEIPKEWEVKKVKHFGNIKSGESVVNSLLTEEGIYEVYGGNGKMGFYNKFNVEGHKIIIGRVGAYCGNVRFINEKKWISDNALILTLINNNLYRYLSILLKAGNLNELNSSSAQPLITGSKVLNFSLPIPPLTEQKEIAAYIETASEKIETAIGLKQEEIEKLKEYKSSLINEVVTGKVKVI